MMPVARWTEEIEQNKNQKLSATIWNEADDSEARYWVHARGLVIPYILAPL